MNRVFSRVCVVFLAFLTLAADDPASPRQRILFGSCLHQDKKQEIWKAMLEVQPDLFIFGGDNIYADTKDMAVMRKKYQQLADQPGFQKMKKQCLILAIWDDHDYGWNDAGADYPLRDESQQVFLDFWGYAKDSPLRSQKGIYHARYFGPPNQTVQILLLDTRYHRSPLVKQAGAPVRGEGPYAPNLDKTTTMLGEDQWKWLAEELKKPAQIRLLISTIQVHSEEHQWEKWMNFPHERERLFQTLRDSKAEGVIVLSGDRHHAELSVMDAGLGYPLFDLTSSGLNQGSPQWRFPEANKHRISLMSSGNNFAQIQIDWKKPSPLICMRVHNEVGEVTIQETIPLSLLKRGAKSPSFVQINNAPYDLEKAKALVGKKVVVDMRVDSTGSARAGALVFLNAGDRRTKEGFTIVLDKKAIDQMKGKGIDDAQAHFASKKIRVEGEMTTFRDQPQIMVIDASKIRVVEE